MAAPHGHRDVYGNIRSLSGGSVVGTATKLWGGGYGVRIIVGTRDLSV
jgi:hypothetical protein